MKTIKLFLIFIILTLAGTLFAQNKVTFMTYNLLNYPNSSSSRNPYFKKIMQAAKPDLLVVDEMENSGGVNNFLKNVLDTSYAAATFIAGYDTNNELYYKKSLFTFLSNIPIKTNLRDINQFTVVYKLTQDTLLIYSAHLKASSGSTNEQKRLAEVNNLRAVTDKLPVNTSYIIAGDFNLYRSTEPAYQALVSQTNPGYFIDPSRAGNWHNNSSYSDIHTQSTHTNTSGDFIGGGLDDRFDFIMFSETINQAINIGYVMNSYHSFGNDGNHFNQSINAGTNTAVSKDIADALYNSSDHLPVIAQFDFGPTVSVQRTSDVISKFELSQNFPNPFNPSTKIKYSIPKIATGIYPFVRLNIYNVLGKKIAELVNEKQISGNYEVTFSADNLPSGIYFYQLTVVGKNSRFSRTKKMILLK